MANEQTGGDDGFTHESASVLFTPPPIDTTVGAESAAEAPPVEAVAIDVVSDAEPPSDEQAEPPISDPSQESASLDTAPAPKSQKKKGPTLSERTAALKKDVDTLTYQKHQTQREMDEAAARLASMRAEVADLEAKRTGPAAPTQPVPAVTASDAVGPMPEHPKYRDFATDEEYETAVGQWRTDTATWQTARETALEQRITGGIDSRLTAAQRAEAARHADTALAQRIDAARAKYPDWAAKTAALQRLRSAWYDPAAHGAGSTTPFLSDLAQHHDTDGAELLPWLGSDPARAQVLADLRPTRPLRDALVLAPSLLPLLDFFVTPDGARAFEELKGMHPIRMNHALGTLSARLMAASRGSAPAAHAMTQAVPPAKPPVGMPGARGAGAPAATQSFDDWYEAENRRELAERKRLAGISA